VPDPLEELRNLAEQVRCLQAEIQSEHDFEQIIGQGPVLRAVLDKVHLIAGTDTVVLILGETGVGKELIARRVHAHGKRRERPLIKVDCVSLPPNQLERTLFGRTTEAAPQAGCFDRAHGGTVFLDEIGELPLEVQGKLLRVLQEREFERVGGGTSVPVDVRIIATSNRDLRRAVRERTFREDLLNRLAVFPIQTPPLRDRREDIPLLAEFFLRRLCRRLGTRFESISAATMERLIAYPWPGNVRELDHVLERAMLLSSGPILEIHPEMLAPPGVIIPAGRSAAEIIDLATLERNHIRTALEKTRWVIDGPHGAARLLGLHPNTLRSRLKKLGLQRPSQESS
jgi:transcriptional regulator with GAF, ATPase, and Fis domain